ncbi:MAG: EamA family transporter [Desulfovibrio sp.]|nr:EamA family transporter [Desulfovibrio sp.]
MSKHLLLMFFTVCCNVAANLFLKSGASVASPTPWGVVNLKTFCGLSLFGLGALFYIAALRIGSLSVSQAIVSLQYVGVLLGAYFLFNEHLSWFQLLGCLFVCLGMIMVTHG